MDQGKEDSLNHEYFQCQGCLKERGREGAGRNIWLGEFL